LAWGIEKCWEGANIADSAVAKCFSFHGEDSSSMSAIVEAERLENMSGLVFNVISNDLTVEA
jgi:hypothetical protein